MKSVFTKNGIVVSACVKHQDGIVIASTVPGTTEHQLPDDSPVDVGYTYDATTGEFTAPMPILPALTPMTFYLAFTPTERIAIKQSTEAHVVEFWATYELAVKLDKAIDPNLVSVQQAVAFLAQKPNDTPPGPGILASRDRIPQILAGIPQ